MKASHIKALDREDIIGSSRQQPWNPLALGASGQPSDGGGLEECHQPASPQELAREWRQRKGRTLNQYK